MNLLFITSGRMPMPPTKGGAVETLIELLIQKNESDFNHNITVLSIYDEEAKKKSAEYKKCKFIYINMNTLISKISRNIRYIINNISNIYIGNAFIAKVRTYLKKNNDYDIIVVENAPEFGMIIEDIVKGKLILHLHNDFLNTDTKSANKILNSYDEVFTLSNFVNMRVKEISNKRKIINLYNGVDISKFDRVNYINSRKCLRDKYKISEDEITILYSGRLVAEKGVKEMIEAFTKLPQDLNVKLIIAGSSKYGKTVNDKYVEELRKISSICKEKILFTGYVKYDEMPEIYSLGDIGVIPSIWEEPFALTVIEQMANGIPIVISDSGGMLELVDENCAIIAKRGTNYINNLKDAFMKLILNSELRYNMGVHAYRKAKEFDKEIYCNRFFSLIEDSTYSKDKEVKD